MIAGYLDELTRIFKTVSDKREAHFRSRGVLQDISTDPSFITVVLKRQLSTPGTLNRRWFQGDERSHRVSARAE
jgi:hypothetical protein